MFACAELCFLLILLCREILMCKLSFVLFLGVVLYSNSVVQWLSTEVHMTPSGVGVGTRPCKQNSKMGIHIGILRV